MERNVEIDKISDGKRYGANDLVKVGCDDCRGCSACCNGMGDSLLMNEEGMQTTENSRIFIGRQIAFDEKVFREQIKELAKEAENECPDICYLVKKMVPEYQYEGEKQG